MLQRREHRIIAEALSAYGDDVGRKIRAVLAVLTDRAMVRKVASALDMNIDTVIAARDTLSSAAQSVWPS